VRQRARGFAALNNKDNDVLPLPERLRARLGLERKSGEETPTTSWALLQGNPAFRWYFCGSVVSDLGTWLQNTAQVLLAYHLSHSVLAVAMVTCAQYSSPLVLGPWAGVMADRFGGRRTLLGTQVVSGLIAAALASLEFGGVLNESWLTAGAILSGLCFTFALPARNVTVRRLVPAADSGPAFSMDSVSYNIGRAVAPLLGIALIHWAGYGWAFAGNAVSFGFFTLVLWQARQHGQDEQPQRSKVLSGFNIARSDGAIMILLLMVAAVTVADDPILVLGPALAHHMHVSASSSGWFIAALGGGSVIGSLRRSRHERSLRTAATALALLGGCMIAFVMTPWEWVSVVAAFGAGVSCLIANSATRTLLCDAAGPKRVASVMAIWAVAWAGSKPFASLTDGLLATHVGVRWTGLILAIPALIPIALLILMPGLAHRLATYHRAPRERGLVGQPVGALVGQPVGALVGQPVGAHVDHAANELLEPAAENSWQGPPEEWAPAVRDDFRVPTR
jgi:MFS family permease